MIRPKVNITFKKLDGTEIAFNFCHSIETDESYQHLTDTAKIVLPRTLKLDGQDLFAGSDPVFQVGDKVTIEMGYHPNLRTIFTGYIKNVSPRLPLVIDCEDQMYLLKQYTVSYPDKYSEIHTGKNGRHLKRPKIISENITLKQLMNNIIADDIDFNILDDMPLGQFRAKNATPVMVLDKLKDEYGLFSYFRNGILQVGFANDASDTREETFDMEKVVINADDLEYQTADQVKIKVKAISMDANNNKTEVEVGDPDGEQKTIHKFNMSKAELTKVAEKWLSEFKYSGFKGELETFGEPYLRHGDRCKIISTKLPERNGTYLVKSVKRRLSVDGGYRQFFTLGERVA